MRSQSLSAVAAATVALTCSVAARAGHEVGDQPPRAYEYRCELTHDAGSSPVSLGEAKLMSRTIPFGRISAADGGVGVECLLDETRLGCTLSTAASGVVAAGETEAGAERFVVTDWSAGIATSVTCTLVE